MSSTSSLQNKVAVITGGSRGIGQAVGDALIRQGARVVIGDILDAEGQKVAEAWNMNAGKKVAAYAHCDVTKYKDLRALFALAEHAFGGVDIAILNAGIGDGANAILTPMDDEEDMKIYQINVGGVVKGTKVALLHMAKRGGGAIVNTASIASFFTMNGLNAYNATKHAVMGWTRSLDHLQEVCNVRVNAVCPFWVDTDMIHGELLSGEVAEYMSKTPKTTMPIVVDAFMQCITDNNINGETLMCLPSGIEAQARIEPHPSMFDDQTMALLPRMMVTQQERLKKELAEARARANI
ncbi:hypothetical protein BCR43DRAFT_515863 [Syncephalastrum racemosum]|uniref:15-hydroxyprostaglandin dehydrogenase n=1 Tax=Syncephalastrum racemosum TaxID=13706 RepID=A0A1X2HAS2_SYNRA|nr:hypothetical protein BCR43DRAFT_515863 [Syncephalastrum racemosum]